MAGWFPCAEPTLLLTSWWYRRRWCCRPTRSRLPPLSRSPVATARKRTRTHMACKAVILLAGCRLGGICTGSPIDVSDPASRRRPSPRRVRAHAGARQHSPRLGPPPPHVPHMHTARQSTLPTRTRAHPRPTPARAARTCARQAGAWQRAHFARGVAPSVDWLILASPTWKNVTGLKFTVEPSGPLRLVAHMRSCSFPLSEHARLLGRRRRGRATCWTPERGLWARAATRTHAGSSTSSAASAFDHDHTSRICRTPDGGTGERNLNNFRAVMQSAGWTTNYQQGRTTLGHSHFLGNERVRSSQCYGPPSGAFAFPGLGAGWGSRGRSAGTIVIFGDVPFGLFIKKHQK